LLEELNVVGVVRSADVRGYKCSLLLREALTHTALVFRKLLLGVGD